MTIIDKNTVVVYTSEELKTVLSETNDYNYVYFGANITLTSGIIISSTKTNITIDGTYNDIKYTYTDMRSTGTGDTISARSANIKKVTVKNMTVIGSNYYGIIFVPEDNNLENIVIEYNNLTYTGPQITFHPTGLSRYIDCNITIITSYVTANEVAECNRIEIGGTTIINHEASSNSSFWYRGRITPYFKILKNANVTIKSTNRELFYGPTNLELSVLESAKFYLTTALGVSYGTYSTSSVLIDKDAYFKITQTKQNGSYPTWYTNGPFVMNENSSLIMINDYASINTSNYNICFRTTSASLTLNNPKELILYNSKANTIRSEQSIKFNLTYNRINLWTTAGKIDIAGSLEDIPTYSWYKEINTSNVTGTISSSTTTITTNDYTEEELTKLPNLSNFKLTESKAISIGHMPLTIYPVTDETTILKGYTTKLSEIKISYLTNETIVTANDEGYFELSIQDPLPIGTEITYLANIKNSFIYQSKTITIIYTGELTLSSVPLNIKFKLEPFSTNPILCPSEDKITITVTDTRVESTNWRLLAKINRDLTSENGYTLPNSAVYISDSNEIIPLSQSETLVYTGENNNGTPKTTIITWDNDKGIVLRIANEYLENKEKYLAIITWILEE